MYFLKRLEKISHNVTKDINKIKQRDILHINYIIKVTVLFNNFLFLKIKKLI